MRRLGRSRLLRDRGRRVGVDSVERNGKEFVRLRKDTVFFFVPLAEAADVAREILEAIGGSETITEADHAS